MEINYVWPKQSNPNSFPSSPETKNGNWRMRTPASATMSAMYTPRMKMVTNSSSRVMNWRKRLTRGAMNSLGSHASVTLSLTCKVKSMGWIGLILHTVPWRGVYLSVRLRLISSLTVLRMEFKLKVIISMKIRIDYNTLSIIMIKIS